MTPKTFKIRTYCTATFEYLVKANTKEEAEEKFSLGGGQPLNDEMPIDIYDETIDKIEDIDDRNKLSLQDAVQMIKNNKETTYD
tara:strand:+ start:330 stop:581 length:252 start_codon:yes stop_codon:yes gene_type:complete